MCPRGKERYLRSQLVSFWRTATPRLFKMGSSAANADGNGAVDKGVDFANYFCTYGFLYHQKEMLCDRVRMDAYYNAVFENKHHFKGKVFKSISNQSLSFSIIILFRICCFDISRRDFASCNSTYFAFIFVCPR